MPTSQSAGLRRPAPAPKYSTLQILPIALCALLLLPSCHSKGTGGAGGALPEQQALQQNIAALTRQEQILSAELALAKNTAPYLSIDVANRKMELKIQGHSLRTFAISKIRKIGGSPFIAATWIETEAKPLQLTERAKVIPGSGESTTASTATKDPWGPARMPADYDLICKNSQALEIRSLASEQSHNRFTRWIVSGYRQVRDWTRDKWGRKNTSYKESLEIWMGEDDAKLLFWSLPKQISILVQNAA